MFAANYLEFQPQRNRIVGLIARYQSQCQAALLYQASSAPKPWVALILVTRCLDKAVVQVVLAVQKRMTRHREALTETLDRVLLHRFFAIPIFFSILRP